MTEVEQKILQLIGYGHIIIKYRSEMWTLVFEDYTAQSASLKECFDLLVNFLLGNKLTK